MNYRLLLIIALVFIIIQFEMFGMLGLDRSNNRLWSAQIGLNQTLMKGVSECYGQHL